jgi:DNA polymerase-3 subunit alpha
MIPQLHIHTEYSLLDGIINVPDLVNHCLEINVDFVPVTDHGSVAAFPELHFETKKAGLKPIYGCEFYFYTSDDFKRTYHIILIAKNNEGLENIIQLASWASEREHFYKKPRINFDMLKNTDCKSLICATACPNGLIFDEKYGERNLMLLYDIFGRNLYLELSAYVDEKKVLRYAKRYNLPYIITNDVHYLKKDDMRIHEMHLASNTKSKLSMKDYKLHYGFDPGFDEAVTKNAVKNIR